MKKSDFEQLLNNMQAYKGKDSLPAPDFDFLIKNVERFSIQSDESDKRYLFKEFLDDYIEDKILMKLYGQELLKLAYKIQNNNWDEAMEIPFIPDTLLKIVNLYEANDEDILFQKLESIKKEMQRLTDDQRKKIIQKLETSQEITKFIEKAD
ncbi:27575_t:CDS:2 [Gigaspora margarita]|uniref:27575_t:CDS:1 n=1 Tax=Gigaspora margarita TaxID=4874 RepID=A0ABN7UT59_GIGMA|nr:27575_t:CDS:2 [Gigaspora margarita]